MPTTNKNTRNNGPFDDDDTVRSSGSGVGENDAFNNGLWNADDGFASTAISAPAGAGDPPGAPTVFGSIATLADHLINGYWAWSGYWGTGPRHFDHSTITVNIQDLTTAERTIAQAALLTWQDVANVTFSYTTGAADITYINDGSGSAVTSYSSVSGTTIASSTIHISSDWSGGAATGNYSYFFQTYVHETGHALGLGHQGPYNGSAVYNTDALWTNDTWRWSVMSYFAQNNYGSDTYDYVLTPQMADIFAIQSIYGARTTTRTGNTTYGFNSNAGSFYDFSSYSGTPAFTLYDSGGTDTLDASGYSSSQTIDLTPGNWSSIGGETNNIGIYLTTTIENAFGGSGADTIFGNDANNTLYGNGGADTLKGAGGADVLSGDAGDDSLNGGDGNDSLYGGDGNDSLKGVGGADYLNGGAGSDTATYDGSTVAINANLSTGVGSGGDAAGDTYYSIENVLGTSGNDTLIGNSDANTLTGNDGDDLIQGFLGNDVLNGGNGVDTLSYDLDRAVTVSLATTAAQDTGGSGTDTVSNFENLIGSYFDDTLTGDVNANVIQGNGGSDTINGLGGNDTIYAGEPNKYYVEAQTRNNSSVATAITLDNHFVQTYSSIIQNSTSTPHATVVATAGGGYEYFKFTVTAGAQAVFDIDQTVGVDTYLQLFGTDGTTLLAAQDDGVFDPGSAPLAGGTSARDSYLSYTFATAGTYYIRVDSYPGGAGPAAGAEFTLNVSLGGATLATSTVGSVLNGGSGADTVYGSSGDDRFIDDDGVSSDIFNAGSGTDWIDFSPVFFVGANSVTIDLSQNRSTWTGGTSETLYNFENVEGSQGGETIIGNSLANVLNGGASDDVIDGFLGNDTLDGGTGVDTLSYALDLGVTVSLATTGNQNTGGSGTDKVSNFENLTGSYFNDTLTGNSGDNVIRGGGGTDNLNGGAGNDTLYSGATNATINKPQGQNNSSIGTAVNLDGHFGLQDSAIIANATTIPHATVTATASGNYEYYSFSVASGATATFDIDHTIGGVDTIIRLYSTDGSTQLAVNDDAALDPGSDDGHDSSLTYVFATGGVYYLRVDSYPSTTPLAIGSTYTLNVSLNSAVVTSVGGGSTLAGGTGDDIYYLANAGDAVVEASGAGTDTVYSGFTYSLAGQYAENLTLTGGANINATGNSLANTLTGNSGNNVLNGGTGADTMAGGAGDDTYYVNATSDSVIEAVDSGTDLVFSSVNYSLSGQHIENLTLTGSGNINGTGNSLANALTGNSGNNVLNGSTGADTMTGGAGDDTYVVDNAGDTVVEASGGGTDLVQSSVSFSLAGQFVENLTLTGSGNINATGNGQANTLTGNSGKNVLDGGTGADTMVGGAGNDTYYVNGAGDSVIEASSGGTDLVFSSISYNLSGQYIEHLTLTGSGNINGTGNSLANALTGNSGNNALDGGSGNDVLNGGAGADVLTGGSGLDTFVFDSALGGAIDTVADFSVANDTIRLDQSIFGAIATLGTLSASAFFAGAGAHDADDRIIYNSATGFLSYDSDGTGANAAVQFALLSGTPAISNTNFTVVA
ncbi:beta strand repeat-containing protein [Reyranella sp.]|uniref:beta strand repeat-containing protein n=1 Tax=Reyranella sp. TaxID=1929291 RepID=UPI003D0EF559